MQSQKTTVKPYIILIVALILILGLIRIGLTYSVFWQTWDEPYHIAAGMEWLDKGQFTYEYKHPPLARIMVALGPYLDGVRGTGQKDFALEGATILHANNQYLRNLTLARIGVLPFFIMATITVWLWSKSLFGVRAALFSAILFTTLPPILAHSGVATTDMALAATLTTALFIFGLWLQKTKLLYSHLLGLSVGLAFISKLSGLLFFSVAATSMTTVYYLKEFYAKGIYAPLSQRRFAASIIACIVCFLTIWAGYRFSGSIRGDALRIPIPAPEFFTGIRELYHHSQVGHPSYFMGEIQTSGWWYFFPILLLLKTPIAFLILTALGFWLLIRDVMQQRIGVPALFPVVAAIAILMVGMQSKIAIGLRHLLSIYPLLAIMGGYGAQQLWQFRRFRRLSSSLLAILLTWQISSSLMAHPDYLAYFNEFAGPHPEVMIGNSDIDWGQDLKRLNQSLKKRRIEEFSLCYWGSAEPERFGIHPKLLFWNVGQAASESSNWMPPYEKATGWIATSLACIQKGTEKPPYHQFDWLESQKPVELIGKSMRLYYIPPR